MEPLHSGHHWAVSLFFKVYTNVALRTDGCVMFMAVSSIWGVLIERDSTVYMYVLVHVCVYRVHA